MYRFSKARRLCSCYRAGGCPVRSLSLSSLAVLKRAVVLPLRRPARFCAIAPVLTAQTCTIVRLPHSRLHPLSSNCLVLILSGWPPLLHSPTAADRGVEEMPIHHVFLLSLAKAVGLIAFCV